MAEPNFSIEVPVTTGAGPRTPLLISKYPRVIRAVANTPWAILPEKLHAILDFLAFKAQGGAVTPELIAALQQTAPAPGLRSGGMIGVLSLFGLISHRANMLNDISGGTSTEKFASQLRQLLADPQVKSIVIDVDSPGGTAEGVMELSDEIFGAREQKKIVAVANATAASAAYWIASAATEFAVIPSGLVGSIGIFGVHIDESKLEEKIGIKTTLVSAGKYKTEGDSSLPLSEEARTAMQALVDEFYEMFVKTVARNRGVEVSAVREGFGEGRLVTARQAVKLGMVDRVATLEESLTRLGAGRNRSVSPLAEGTDPLDELELKRRRFNLSHPV